MLQSTEERLLWMYRRNQGMPVSMAADEAVGKARTTLNGAIFVSVTSSTRTMVIRLIKFLSASIRLSSGMGQSRTPVLTKKLPTATSELTSLPPMSAKRMPRGGLPFSNVAPKPNPTTLRHSRFRQIP